MHALFAKTTDLFADLCGRRKLSEALPKVCHLTTLPLKLREKDRKRMAEIEKLKKRREERAVEKAQREEDIAMLAREGARAEFHDWEKKEKEFYFKQSKIGSEIRLREGRLKPIDILSKHLNGSDDFDMEMNEPPYSVFEGLTVRDGGAS